MGKYNEKELKTGTYSLKGTEFTITQLAGRDMKNIVKLNLKEEDGLLGMVFASLKQTDKDIKFSDVEDLPVNILSELIKLVSELNE